MLAWGPAGVYVCVWSLTLGTLLRLGLRSKGGGVCSPGCVVGLSAGAVWRTAGVGCGGLGGGRAVRSPPAAVAPAAAVGGGAAAA